MKKKNHTKHLYMNQQDFDVQTALNAYQELLTQYEKEIIDFQRGLEAAGENRGDPPSIINAHITNFDVYLLNPFHAPLYYEIKWRLLPKILKYLAAIEGLNPEDLQNLELKKVDNEHSQNVALLLKNYSPISKFVNDKIQQQRQRIDKLEYPWPPKKASATRQRDQYIEKKDKYDQELEQLNQSIEEMETLNKLFQEEKNNLNNL